MRVFAAAVIAVTLAICGARAQQLADPSADMSVTRPAYARDAGPVVAIDSGHHNFHTVDGRYAPLAQVLRNDGYRLRDHRTSFTAESLAGISVLIVSNALAASNVDNWAPPYPPAFTADDIAAVKRWVEQGGSLLLIADHRPMADAVSTLAQALGFRFFSGVVSRDPPRDDIFTIGDGSLSDDAITRGRSPEETVTSVQTFTGSAFKTPTAAWALITLPRGYFVHDCGLPCPPNVAKMDATGLLQGAVMNSGRGRIAVFGEAAMFSAQTISEPSRPLFRFGFNAPTAKQNKQFVLNLLHWLSGALPGEIAI
jgi:hypothetical protein